MNQTITFGIELLHTLVEPFLTGLHHLIAETKRERPGLISLVEG